MNGRLGVVRFKLDKCSKQTLSNALCGPVSRVLWGLRVREPWLPDYIYLINTNNPIPVILKAIADLSHILLPLSFEGVNMTEAPKNNDIQPSIFSTPLRYSKNHKKVMRTKIHKTPLVTRRIFSLGSPAFFCCCPVVQGSFISVTLQAGAPVTASRRAAPLLP